MKKRTISILLSLQLLASGTAFALHPGATINASTTNDSAVLRQSNSYMENTSELSQTEKDKQIASLFEEMEQLSADGELHPEIKIINEAKIKECEAKLADLGVTELAPEEVADITGSQTASLAKLGFTCPTSTTNVKWYSSTSQTTYDGKKYSVQLIYAQNKTQNSSLAFGKNGQTLYKSQSVAVADLKTIASIYAQKAIGLIPIVSWAPYELLFSDNSSVKNNDHIITYRGTQTACFCYVAKASSPSDQTLAQITNSITVASSHTLAGYKNGKAYTQSKDTTNTSSSGSFGSVYSAAKQFAETGSRTQYDCIWSITFYNHNKTKSISGDVPVPHLPAQCS